MQSFLFFYLDVKVTHDETGEVKPCHLVEQLVFVHGVGLVGHHEDELIVTLGNEHPGGDGVAVLQHLTAPRPYIAHVKASSMQPASGLHTINDHTCHGTDLALRIMGHHLLHIVKTTLAVAVVQLTQSSDKEELVAMGTQGETAGGKGCIGTHLLQTVGLEGSIGSGIEGIFEVGAEAGVLLEVRIGKEGCPLTLRIAFFQLFEIPVGCGSHALALIEQPQMVEHIVHVLIVGILVGETTQLPLSQTEVVELVLEQHTTMEQGIFDDGIALGDLLLSKRDLCQIIFSFVGIVLCTVKDL